MQRVEAKAIKVAVAAQIPRRPLDVPLKKTHEVIKKIRWKDKMTTKPYHRRTSYMSTRSSRRTFRGRAGTSNGREGGVTLLLAKQMIETILRITS